MDEIIRYDIEGDSYLFYESKEGEWIKAENLDALQQKLTNLNKELEEYRSIAEIIGASKAISEKDQILAQLKEMTQERDEARQIVAKVNNSVIGSDGYFIEPSCVDAIEVLKTSANSMRQQLVERDRMFDGHVYVTSEEWASVHQQLAEATYRLNVLEPEYTACQARAAYLEQQLAQFNEIPYDKDYRSEGIPFAAASAWRAECNRVHEQLATANAHLEAQWTATYQAVEREHKVKKELAEAQARVWEEAANKIEHERNTNCNYYDAMTRAYLWCHKKAKETQP